MKPGNASVRAEIVGWALRVCVVALLMGPGLAEAQDLRGRVLEQGSDRRIAGAVVRVLDTDDEGVGVAISDSVGTYAVAALGPGEYRLTVEAYGYEPFRSPLLSVGDRKSYAVDIELTATPLPIAGVSVSAERFAELERGLRLTIGVHPRSLRLGPILRPEIEDHIARAHGVTELVRWSNLPSIVTVESTEGPCFRWRKGHCLPVYLNGAVLSSQFVPTVPLEMFEMIVIMTPGESAAYPSGAVLLYTPGWIG